MNLTINTVYVAPPETQIMLLTQYSPETAEIAAELRDTPAVVTASDGTHRSVNIKSASISGTSIVAFVYTKAGDLQRADIDKWFALHVDQEVSIVREPSAETTSTSDDGPGTVVGAETEEEDDPHGCRPPDCSAMTCRGCTHDEQGL